MSQDDIIADQFLLYTDGHHLIDLGKFFCPVRVKYLGFQDDP